MHFDKKSFQQVINNLFIVGKTADPKYKILC